MKNLVTRVVCAIALALGLLAVLPASVRAQTPTALPLVQAGNMRYLGSFAVVASDGSGVDEGLLTYGGAALSVNPATQTLLLAGHDWYGRLCEVRIPAAPGQTASAVQRCGDVTEGRLGQIDGGDETKLGGTLVWNGRLIVSAYSYYDADGNSSLSHFASGLNFAQSGDVQGPFRVGTFGAGFVAGYMGVIPNEWRALFGGPALTGQCCLSIISRTSSGPSVSVFNPDDVGRVSPVPAVPLVGYPLSTPLAPNGSQNALFNNATEITGVAFPVGTRSVLFIGKQGTGPYCYGEAVACGDPEQIYKGSHAYPYVHQVWAYDANDLLAVKLGLRQPWSVRPYATWPLTGISSAGDASIRGAAYDHTTGRVYITERYGENPRVHVYEIGGGSALPLPGAPQNLSGSVQGSVVSLSWSPPAGGGYAGYVVEAGNAPGSPTLQLPVGPTTTSLTAPVLPGTYYVRIRAFNATPAAGPSSNEVALTVGGGPSGPAAKPQNFRVSVTGTSVTFSWSPPAAGETVTDYLLDAGTSPGASNLVSAAALGAGFVLTVPNVPAGTYHVRIRARNPAGVSVPSDEASFTVATVALPGAPTSFRAVVGGNRSLTLSWAAPRTGGTATSYVLEVGAAPGANQLATDVGPTTTLSIPGVPPGTYYLRARARNAAGLGSPTADVRVVVP